MPIHVHVQVQFPGVSARAFRALQEFLYLGDFAPLPELELYMELLELANRMCLRALLATAESHVITTFQSRDARGLNVMEDVLDVLEIAQV